MSRFREPSTYAGAAAVIAGAGQIFGVSQYTGPAAEAVAGIAAAPSWQGGILALLGFAAMFLREGRR